MNFSADVLPQFLYWMAALTYVGLLSWAIYKTRWNEFVADPRRVHVFLGSCVLMLVIWQLHAGLKPGLGFHLLGGTLFVLMFGWPLAFVGLAVVVLGSTINGMGDLLSIGINGLVMTAIPVFVSYGVYRFALRFLPHHFFVYVIGNAFFCGGLAMLAAVSASSALLACCGPYALEKVADVYLPFAPMMIFAEAFFTGMIAASLVLFRPEWISTFDDRRYLSGK